MRTTVTIPDDVFVLADEEARRRGLTRSQLYAEAVRRFLASERRRAKPDQDMIERINAACAEQSTGLDPVLMEMQMRSIDHEDWR